MPHMRNLMLILLTVAACSDNPKPATVDAPTVDAPIDTPTVTLDCTTYCTTITANCSGANTQYQDIAHCMGTCGKFAVGALTDTGGQNTLGCRLYHAQNAVKTGQTPE